MSFLISGTLYLAGYSFSFLHCFSLLSSAIHKACSDNYFAFLHFFFFEKILITASCRVMNLSSHLQSFPALGSFQMSQLFASGAPKYQSFSFSNSPSTEYSGLISFRIDFLDFLVVQGSFKSHLQHCSSKASKHLALSFLHSPALTSIHDYWKNHSFDQTDLCWQSKVSAF